MTLSHIGLARPGKAGSVSGFGSEGGREGGRALRSCTDASCTAVLGGDVMSPAPPPRPPQGATPSDCQNHLHQLHVCLPSRVGHTRLLYRMSTDFLGWTDLIPGIHLFWKHIAGQVCVLGGVKRGGRKGFAMFLTGFVHS